jgi:hypothetical protein
MPGGPGEAFCGHYGPRGGRPVPTLRNNPIRLAADPTANGFPEAYSWSASTDASENADMIRLDVADVQEDSDMSVR